MVLNPKKSTRSLKAANGRNTDMVLVIKAKVTVPATATVVPGKT